MGFESFGAPTPEKKVVESEASVRLTPEQREGIARHLQESNERLRTAGEEPSAERLSLFAALREKLGNKVAAYATAVALALGAAGYATDRLAETERSLEQGATAHATVLKEGAGSLVKQQLESQDAALAVEGETNDQAYKRHMAAIGELPSLQSETGTLQAYQHHLREARRIVNELPTDTEEERAYKAEREEAVRVLESIRGVVEELQSRNL